MCQSIEYVLVPLVDGSLTQLDDIKPETEEVKQIKKKYVKVMEAYKSGFETILEGCNTQDEATIGAGYDELERAVELLDDYNKALEELAKKYDAQIEY